MSEGLLLGWASGVVCMLGWEELSHPLLATIGDGAGGMGPGAHQLMVASLGLRRNGVMGSEACP